VACFVPELTARSETGVQRGIPSVVGDKIGAVAVVQSETGTELGISDPEVKCEKSDRGALIKLTNIEPFDFEACLRVRVFQFTRGSALYRE
jgi:hypothetical protein